MRVDLAGILPASTIVIVMRRRFPELLPTVVFVVVSGVAYTSIVCQRTQLGTLLHGTALRQSVVWYLLAFVAYAAIMLWLERHGHLPAKWIWGAALLLRLVLLLAPPAFSGDVYRYLWDGHVARNGVSPYAYAINDPNLDHLDIPIRQLTNHPGMATPYPPAAQLLFSTAAFLFPPKPLVMQVAMVVFDLANGLLLAKLLALAQLPGRRLALYLWNPLIIVEFASSAHLGAWVIMLAFSSILLTFGSSGRTARAAAPLMLALASLSWIVPVLLLPVLFWRWSWRQRLGYALVLAGLLLPSGIRAGWGLTGPLDGTGLFGALRIFAAQWNFNSGLFYWLERALGAPGYGPPSPVAKIAVLVLLILVLLAVLWAARKRRSLRSDMRLMAVPLMAYLLLSPTVHPWYLPPLLAFLPFLSPGAKEGSWHWLMVMPWVYLSGAVLLSYFTYLDPVNPGELAWVRVVEWVPTLVSLFFGALWTLLKREPVDEADPPVSFFQVERTAGIPLKDATRIGGRPATSRASAELDDGLGINS